MNHTKITTKEKNQSKKYILFEFHPNLMISIIIYYINFNEIDYFFINNCCCQTLGNRGSPRQWIRIKE
jgi:hypothetical protein